MRKSDRLKIGGGGFAAALIGLHVERKLLALVEISYAGSLDCRDVNEHIGAAVVLHDKAETLLGVEELNGTCGHPYKNAQRRLCAMQTIRMASLSEILRVLGERPLGRNCKVRRNREQ